MFHATFFASNRLQSAGPERVEATTAAAAEPGRRRARLAAPAPLSGDAAAVVAALQQTLTVCHCLALHAFLIPLAVATSE